MTRWAILTGEYPPQPGGVADYTRLVAVGLRSAGDEATVFAPPCDPEKQMDKAGINVVRLQDHFGPRGLVELDRTFARTKVDRVLIQYVPHAFGWKAMNLPFAIWVATRARRLAPVWVMFHEVAFPFRWRPPTHAVLGGVTRAMARLVAGAAERIFSTISAWGPLIHRLCPRAKPVEWLPVPSNVPDDPRIEPVRSSPGTVIGHFGTYGPSTTELLEPTLISLLRVNDRSATLLGRGGIMFRERLIARYPHLSARLVALGDLAPNELVARMRGCDVLLQPFIDGVSTRRTSAMAGLANGIPLISNLGELSEALWGRLGCIGLAQSPSPAELSAAVEAVLSMNPAERTAMGQRAAKVYRDKFGLENTIACLRNSQWRNCA
jgi:glycosyltransferase involved in cell wall biosynthesis